MANEVSTRNPADIVEQVIIKGDLSKLTAEERSTYYMRVCESVGLNPFTKPFEYIQLNGKLTLYALRACTDQLRSIHKVSVLDMTEAEREGVFIVTAKVQNGEGRTDMAKGAVTISGLKGDALANAMMKAETKAKRRATLSICGLGFLDETEIETVPGARPNGGGSPAASKVEPAKIEPSHDPKTGEIAPHAITLPKKADGATDWISFGGKFIASAMTSKTAAELADWQSANKAALEAMKEEFPKAHERVEANVKAMLDNLGKPEKAAA